jgi:Ca2+-binding EF-hand superfamily protein
MIKNSLGEEVEFDMKRAKELSERFDKWAISEIGNLPIDVCDILLSVWGYAAALDEIEYLRSELKKHESA